MRIGMPVFTFGLLLVLTSTPAVHGAEARLLTLDDIQEMGGTDFDGGVGDYLLRNDQVEAVILAIGATPDFNIPYVPGSLPSRGVLIDIGTPGHRNDQFDELHQVLNFDFEKNFIVYLGSNEGLPDPIFQNGANVSSITVFGIAVLSLSGTTYSSFGTPTLQVQTTYSVTDGNSWIDIETTVTNIGDQVVPLFTISDVDVTIAKGRLAFQSFPNLGPAPNANLSFGNPATFSQWSYLVSPGVSGPQDGPANNDGSPAGEVCYGFLPVEPAQPMVGFALNLGAVASSYVDLDAIAVGNIPLLAPGDATTYSRRLVVGDENTVDACLRVVMNDLFPHGGALFRGRIVDGQGNPIPEAHIFFDNTTPGSPAYPTIFGIAEGTTLPLTHTISDSDGRFEVELPALADPASEASVYTAKVKAQERETLDIGPFTVDTAAISGGPVELGDFIVSGTGTLNFRVLRMRRNGQQVATPVKLSIYGTGETENPDFGREYLSLRDFPGLDPWNGDDTDYLGEAFAGLPALNFWVDADGAGTIDLSPGTYMVYASRGHEYTLDSAEVTITEGQTTNLELEIRRAVPSAFMVSMDAHVHGIQSFDASSPMTSRVLSYLAAGIEIMISTDHDYVTDYTQLIADLGIGREIRAIVGTELTSRLPVPDGPLTGDVEDAFPLGIGHWGAWPVSRIPGARRNGAVQDEFLNPGTAIDRLRGASSLPLLGARPGTATLEEWLAAIQAGEPGTPGANLPSDDEVVVFNHPRDNTIGLFATLANPDLDNGGYDSSLPISDFPNNLMTVPSLYNKAVVGPAGTDTNGFSFDAIELINGGDQGHYMDAREDWFSLLDQGIHRTGVANSDSHRVVIESPGIGRSYVVHQSPNPMKMGIQELMDNVKAMRVVGTTGPLIRLAVLGDGVSFGDLARLRFSTIGETVVATGETVDMRILVMATPWIPVEEIRIFVNGEQVMTIPIPEGKVLNGPAARFDRLVKLQGIDRDSYITVEAGIQVDEDGNPVHPELLETMELIELRTQVPFAFTNPVFVDRDGNGYVPPGLP